MTDDERLEAFLSNPREVFHSVQHRHEVWREDPFDVEQVHGAARQVFRQMLSRATTRLGVDSGRILLLLGESGAGKTHLVRSFRNHVHSQGMGFVGYMQMTTATASYGRYVLSNLIDSFDQPHYESLAPTSSLKRLSNALAYRSLDESAYERLREDADLGSDDMAEIVSGAADRLIDQPRFASIDIDLLRALLYLQRDDARIKSRVLKYLRCEDLSDRDRKMLGGLVPKVHDDDPPRMVEHLGRVMSGLDSLALVVCLDQLEDLFNVSEGEGVFRRALATICALADRVPTSVFVICCLEDYFKQIEPRLTRPMLDRIQRDPEPVRLESSRTRDEVELLVAQRLRWLYETSGVEIPEREPTYPIPRAMLDRLSGLRTRDVLERCRDYRERCIAERRLVSFVRPTLPGVGPDFVLEDPEKLAIEEATIEIETAWNDYLVEHHTAPPDEDDELASLLAWAIEGCADELQDGYRVRASAKNATIEATISAPSGATERLLVGLCNKSPRGGRLGKQIAALVHAAGDRIPVVVHCAELPDKPGPVLAKSLGELDGSAGRHVFVEDGDWRAMQAFRAFHVESRRRPFFSEWIVAQCHLSRLRPLCRILDLDRLDRLGRRASAAAPRASSPP